jgi:hypothetical protein
MHIDGYLLAPQVGWLAFTKPIRRRSFSEQIWKSHQIIVNPASDAEEVKDAKRQMLRLIRKGTNK